jgi:hypothetical protein
MGTRDELRNMIQTCRKNGVRVYAGKFNTIYPSNLNTHANVDI